MPLLLWPILTAIGALLGIDGTAYGVDQHQKRKQEREAFRARLQQLEQEFVAKEGQLNMLRDRLGEKNTQVRALAEEVERLLGEMGAMKRSA